jgi:hypothetical protein
MLNASGRSPKVSIESAADSWDNRSVMSTIGKTRSQKAADAKRVTDYGVREVAGIRLLITLQYLQDDSDADGTVIRLSLNPLQALDFGVRLIDQVRGLMLPHAPPPIGTGIDPWGLH